MGSPLDDRVKVRRKRCDLYEVDHKVARVIEHADALVVVILQLAFFVVRQETLLKYLF